MSPRGQLPCVASSYCFPSRLLVMLKAAAHCEFNVSARRTKRKKQQSEFLCPRRDHSARGSVDGWGLMHSLLTDVVKSVLAVADVDSTPDDKQQNSQGSSWSVLSSLAADPCKGNVIGNQRTCWSMTGTDWDHLNGSSSASTTLCSAARQIAWHDIGDSDKTALCSLLSLL